MNASRLPDPDEALVLFSTPELTVTLTYSSIGTHVVSVLTGVETSKPTRLRVLVDGDCVADMGNPKQPDPPSVHHAPATAATDHLAWVVHVGVLAPDCEYAKERLCVIAQTFDPAADVSINGDDWNRWDSKPNPGALVLRQQYRFTTLAQARFFADLVGGAQVVEPLGAGTGFETATAVVTTAVSSDDIHHVVYPPHSDG